MPSPKRAPTPNPSRTVRVRKFFCDPCRAEWTAPSASSVRCPRCGLGPSGYTDEFDAPAPPSPRPGWWDRLTSWLYHVADVDREPHDPFYGVCPEDE